MIPSGKRFAFRSFENVVLAGVIDVLYFLSSARCKHRVVFGCIKLRAVQYHQRKLQVYKAKDYP